MRDIFSLLFVLNVTAHPTPHGEDGSSFTPEAYPVKWKRDDPSPPQDGLAARQSSFTPEAYSMKWFDPPPHKDLAARQSSFTPESYPAGAVERKQGSRRMVRTCIFFFHHI